MAFLTPAFLIFNLFAPGNTGVSMPEKKIPPQHRFWSPAPTEVIP